MSAHKNPPTAILQQHPEHSVDHVQPVQYGSATVIQQPISIEPVRVTPQLLSEKQVLLVEQHPVSQSLRDVQQLVVIESAITNEVAESLGIWEQQSALLLE